MPCIIAVAKWNRHWKPFWVPYGDGFKKANVEEWEQDAHASECFGWDPGQRWTEPSPWSWSSQDLSDEETFARVTRESSDESKSNCGLFWAAKPVNSNSTPVDTFRHPQTVPPSSPSTPQSPWQPYTDTNTSGGSYQFRRYVIKRSNELDTNMPVIVELLEVHSPSEQAPTPMERTVPDVV